MGGPPVGVDPPNPASLLALPCRSRGPGPVDVMASSDLRLLIPVAPVPAPPGDVAVAIGGRPLAAEGPVSRSGDEAGDEPIGEDRLALPGPEPDPDRA